jgi:phosphoribosylaminoimidazole-succinocarboxamide synthase
MEVLRKTEFDFLGKRIEGKVRDIYEPSTGSGQGSLILIATDRHSSFDRHLADIPHKGQVLNQISKFWMEKTADIVPNHIIAVPDPNVTVAKKCTPVAVEAVVRGYLTGVTGTAIWTRYQNGMREVGGVTLSEGMKKNQKLPQPIFDPTTKEAEHDRALTPEEMIAEGFITKERFDEIKKVALALFARGQEVAAEHGLILVDTKYEFGIDADGRLTVIDEMHTPDSSRYWRLASYKERLARGQEPEYFDKEFLRLWFKDNCDPYNDPVLPEAPAELVQELSRRYIAIYEEITGQGFEPGETPITERLERHLRPFAPTPKAT